MFLLFQVDMDSMEVSLEGQCWALSRQDRVLPCPPLHHRAGVQVWQLLAKCGAQLCQDGLVPGSRGLLGVEEVGDLPQYLMGDRHVLGVLEVACIQHLPRESEVSSVPQTQSR